MHNSRSSDDFDKIVNTVIPDQYKDYELFETVTKCVIHAPCHIVKNCPIKNKNNAPKGFLKVLLKNHMHPFH